MREYLKPIGIGVLIVIVFGGGFLGLQVRKANGLLNAPVTLDGPIATAPIPTDPESLARGEHLARVVGVCGECHGDDMGGKLDFDDLMMGRMAPPNLTRGGLGATLTDEDWFRAIRHGVTSQGRAILIMPSAAYNRAFTLEEVAAMVGWLKSLPPVERDLGEPTMRLGIIFSLIYLGGGLEKDVGFVNIDHSAAPPAAVEEGPTVAYGNKLAAPCRSCHGQDLAGLPPSGPPGTPPARNLTPHETGLKEWTRDEFAVALRESKGRDGRELNLFMPRAYKGLTDVEIDAMWAYLGTTTPTPWNNGE